MTTETLPNICTKAVPYEDAVKCHTVLFDVLTLIHAVVDVNENGSALSDKNDLTDEKSRITNLLAMARDKTAEALKHLGI